MSDGYMVFTLCIVALASFVAGRLWEIIAQQRQANKDRLHDVVAGAYYELSNPATNPFDGPVLVQVLCIKDGWVQYRFADAPSCRPDSKTIRDFCAIYRPAII